MESTFKPRKIRLKKPPPLSANTTAKEQKDELKSDDSKERTIKSENLGDENQSCASEVPGKSSDMPEQCLKNPKSIVDKVFQQFISEKIGDWKDQKKIDVLDSLVDKSDKSDETSLRVMKHHKKKHKKHKDKVADGFLENAKKKKHKKKHKKGSKSDEKERKVESKKRSEIQTEEKTLAEETKSKTHVQEERKSPHDARGKNKSHKKSKKKNHTRERDLSSRVTKPGEANPTSPECDIRKVFISKKSASGDECDSETDINAYHSELFCDRKARKHDKHKSGKSKHKPETDSIASNERDKQLRNDIAHLQARIMELKGSREHSISEKHEEMRKERHEARRQEKKHRKRRVSSREKHGSSDEKQSRKRHHSKPHVSPLKITAPIEVQNFDRSITPPYSPHREYTGDYYQHPEKVDHDEYLKMAESHVTRQKICDSKYFSKQKVNQHDSEHNGHRTDVATAFGDEKHTRRFSERRRSCHETSQYESVPQGEQNPSSVPYHLYASERDITVDRDLGPAYDRERKTAVMEQQQAEERRARQPKYYRSIRDIEPERDIRELICEAEEELKKTAELEKEGRKFINAREREIRDQEIYDILLREGPIGLQKLKEREEEKERQRLIAKENEEKAKKEKEEQTKLDEEKDGSDGSVSVEEFPLEKDIVIDEADIETKEREMMKEIQEKKEKRKQMKRMKEAEEILVQNMEEERTQLERELDEIRKMSDDEYVKRYGMAGALRRKEEHESGEVTSDSDAYEVVSDSEVQQATVAGTDAEQHDVTNTLSAAAAAAGCSVCAQGPSSHSETAAVNSDATSFALEEITLPSLSGTEVPQSLDEDTSQTSDQPPPPGVESPIPLPPTAAKQPPPVSMITDESSVTSVKKPSKVLGLKISQTSAALISAAKPDDATKVTSKEDGEVSESSESSSLSWSRNNKRKIEHDTSSDDGDDNTLPDSSGSITDSGSEAKGKKKKKKKKKKVKKAKRDKVSSRRRMSRSPSPRRRYKSYSRSRSRSHERGFKSRGVWRSRSRSRERYGDVVRRKKYRSRSRDRTEDRYSSRGRSFSTRDSRDRRWYEDRQRRGYHDDRKRGHSPKCDARLDIDKAKLREIAIRNAVSSMKTGAVPPVPLKAETLAHLRAGGKSLGDLTDFCKRIAEKAADKAARGSDDSEPDTDVLKQGSEDEDQPFVHHPFKVKEAPIIMNIRNSKQLPILTPKEKMDKSSILRIEFPVSSGSHHRAKEWVPVEKPEPKSLAAHPPTVSAVPPTTKVIPAQPAIAPPPVMPPQKISKPQDVAEEIVAAREAEKQADEASMKAEVAATHTFPAAAAAAAPRESNRLPVAPEDRVFPETPSMNMNIGDLLSQRLGAMRRLQDNPNDVEATAQLYEAQKNMNQWAESKNLPGKFLGSTGAQVLTAEEIMGDPRNQAWARKDQLHSAAPVSGGIGKFLLQKMGWSEGEGLGKDKSGQLEPLKLDVKMDRKGLNTEGETGKKALLAKATASDASSGQMASLSGKHPVSALLELVKRKKWSTASFDIVHESGPPHKKNFVFKVSVNGVDYQPTVASNSKKHAKMMAAVVCLQALGIPCQPVESLI